MALIAYDSAGTRLVQWTDVGMTARGWRWLCLGSLITLIVSGWLGNWLDGRIGRNAIIALGAVLGASLLAFIVSIPPVMVRSFVQTQTRIGNGGTPMVKFVAAHERAVVWLVWGTWGLGILIAAPLILRDLRATP